MPTAYDVWDAMKLLAFNNDPDLSENGYAMIKEMRSKLEEDDAASIFLRGTAEMKKRGFNNDPDLSENGYGEVSLLHPVAYIFKN
eukprot:CAMPEP_0185281042 /NCGR_PEP_ID=MMETSP1359-20130426/66494_1 /TAXON_ID=552665 /ORGANISM="Bigelowiella longifila, Strain CCMP242" /LENGTH=84 /DNA_ID=CAMNT_0027876423 /DNA_START=312 /DNA_END=566 /DNA_ORIENTATION=+